MSRKFLTLPLLLLAVLLLSGCGYNSMQRNEEAVFKAWGDLESQLQRRADLIPNLVQVVKGFAAQEKETLTAVIEARSRATSVQLSPEALSDPQAVARFQEAQLPRGPAADVDEAALHEGPPVGDHEHEAAPV